MPIVKGTNRDIDELENLYDNLNDYLESTINHPGWIKHVYPVRETAVEAIKEGSLFVSREQEIITGSIILNHEPEEAYQQVKWLIDADYTDILVIRTLVVHPAFQKRNIATSLLEFAQQYAISQQLKSIRLDVSEKNLPAINLYRKMGYRYIQTVDLGLPYDHLKWFELYELVL
ncbi:MAG: GNAT family N-acetyltransferase [Bacteroides sp.]|nr:GNAT family N-acetyltransferase [Bacteroides sp.]